MNLRHLIIRPVIASILLILGLSTPSNAQAVDPAWYSTTLLQPEIEKGVAAAILRMPFRQETPANAIIAPLRYRYVNRNAPADIPFVSGSKTVFTAEWTINVHTNNGRQYIIPSDRLESVYRQKSNPCGILPIVPGPAPFGPASCAAMKGEGQAKPGDRGTAAVWRLKDGYPKPDANFLYLIKENPINKGWHGGFVAVGARGMVLTFSFSPPPATMEVGKTYEVSLTGVSVAPDDQPDCAGGGDDLCGCAYEKHSRRETLRQQT